MNQESTHTKIVKELDRLEAAQRNTRHQIWHAPSHEQEDLKALIKAIENQINLLTPIKASHMDKIKTTLVGFDIHKHSLGVEVVSLQSGRKGTVLEIKQTGYEYIEPLVKWQDGEVSISSDQLYLTDGAI